MAPLSSLPMPTTPLPADDSNSSKRKATCTTRDGQCTHLTMTRIYGGDFRCAICLQPGSMGWLYRCTQDRELLIEDDLEKDVMIPFDKLVTLLPFSSSPKKRSPAARTSSNLSFLDEISQEGFKSYTPVQVGTILKQRAQLLNVIKESESNIMMLATEGLRLNIHSEKQPLPFSRFPASSEVHDTPPKKSWLPTQECQFKCCQRCRPSFHERSYLSLDAVADGELPATAVTGFGFHYQKGRPVALAEYVRNIGLRPNPIRRKNSCQAQPQRASSVINPSLSPKNRLAVEPATSSSPFNDELNADTTFGQVSNAYDSMAMTRSLNVESSPLSYNSGSSFGAAVRKAFEDMIIMRLRGAEVQGTNKFEMRKDPHETIVRPPWTPPNSPDVQKENDLVYGRASENEAPVFNGRSSESLKTDRGLSSHFNLDEYHEDDDAGLLHPLDDARNRNRTTTLSAETTQEQATDGVL